MATNLLWFDGINEARALAPEVLTFLSLSNVENTALSTWAGTANLTTVGTIATGVWHGTVIATTYGGTGNANGTAAGIFAGSTGIVTFAGVASTNRVKTLRDAADTILELGGSYTPTGTWTSLTMVTPVLGTPTSGNLTNCTFPTLNQNTTGSAASLSISGQTALLTFTGIFSTNRIKTVRDAADTILELGGSYSPTGIWTSLTMVTPVLGTPTSGNLANCTFPTLNQNTSGTAVGIAGGSIGQLHYQTGAGATGFVAVGTSGQLLQSAGGAIPVYTTATYPGTATSTGVILRANGTNWVATTSTFADTYGVSTLLYASSANVVTGLATANNGVLVTNGSGVPSIATTLPSSLSVSSLKYSVSAAVTAAGSIQGTATALTSDYNIATTVAASTGVVLPTAAAGLCVLVVNKGANALAVYPASGGTIDALSANAAYSLAVGAYLILNAVSTTQWYSSVNNAGGGSTATNIGGGTAGQVVYQISAGSTGFVGPGSTGQVLQSNSTSVPTYSTATYPSTASSTGVMMRANGTNWVATTSTFADTYSASTLLYSNGANTVTGLATANNGVLVTNGSGVPSISTTLPSSLSVDKFFYSTSAAVTAAGSVQGTATALTSDFNVVATATSQQGVVLPTPTLGQRVKVVNKSGQPILVYPASGGTIDYGAANSAIQLVSTYVVEFQASSTTQWYSSLATLINQINPGTLIFEPQFQAVSVTATGSTQGTAANINCDITNVNSVAAGTGVVLQGANAGIRRVVVNSGANALIVYPGSGTNIDSLSANVGITLQVGAYVEFYSASGTQWYTNRYTPIVNLFGGTAGQIPYQSGVSATAFVGPGSAGQVLQSNSTSGPVYSTATYPATASSTGVILRANGTNWVATTSTFADTYSVSTILYASSANVVSGLATANSGVLITSGAGVPSISSTLPSALNISGAIQTVSATVSAAGSTQGTATALTSDINVVTTVAASSGVILQTTAVGKTVIVVNKGANALLVYPAVSSAIDALGTNTGFSLAVGSWAMFNGVTTTLWYSTSNASTATTALTGTVTNAQLANSTVTIGSTAVALGATVTTYAGLVSVTSTTFVGALTGNASTATSIAGGALGQLHYQTGAGATGFVAVGTSGQLLQSAGSAIPVYTTATYPGTATSTGVILRANGTNWVATTSTFADTYGVSTLLYASSANVVAGLATANNGVLVTSGGGVPSISATLPTGLAIAGAIQTVSATVSAAGTTQGGATALTNDINVITTVAASSGVVLPASVAGKTVIVVNKGANALAVYPPTSSAIDALSVNTAISIPVSGWMEFNAISTTQWYSTNNAPINATMITTGTLAVAQGGTGATATTGSAGFSVLSVSPTFTGTVSAAALTLTGLLTTVASATGSTGINIPHGAAPTSPINGDVWTTTAGLFARINGSTVGPYGTGGSGFTWSTITSANVATAATNTGYMMDTGGSIRTVTLPASVAAGFNCTVCAVGGQVRLVSNGNVIVGVGAGNDLLLASGNTATVVADTTGNLQIVYGGSTANGNAPAGGSTNQVLTKSSGTDYNYAWALVTLASMATLSANSIIGNNTGSGATPIALTALQTSALLQGDGLTSLQTGFRNIPQNSKSAAYTTVAADSGGHILHPAADTTARTFTIDSNANVAYPIGTAITFINQNAGGVITIAITTDTMRLAGAGTTGSRTLAANGVATAIKLTSTEWIISGTGLT